MSVEANILICGLGGQGVILASRVLADAAFADGNEVLTGDVVGATQRFGLAYSYVRVGEEIFSTTFPEGEADLILGFEPLQSLKIGVTFAHEDGLVLISDRAIGKHPGLAFKYPQVDEIINDFKRMGVINIKHFDAGNIAIRETGNIVTLNMVMLGAALASGKVPIQKSTVEAVITKVSRKDNAESNLRAFIAGFNYFAELK